MVHGPPLSPRTQEKRRVALRHGLLRSKRNYQDLCQTCRQPRRSAVEGQELPHKEDEVFASLDLSEAYHCVDVAEEDKVKSAVISPKSLHAFNKMSFGLKSAPQAFHQIVQMIKQTMHNAR